MAVLHTLVGSRHFEHKDNIGTAKGIQTVQKNTQSLLTQGLIQVTPIHTILASNQARTGSTARKIAEGIVGETASSIEIKERDRLNLKPKNGPLKDILDRMGELYDLDPSVEEKGYSDEFVDKLQQNKLEGVNFHTLSIFYCTKLLNALNHIDRYTMKNNNLENVDTKSLSVMGIHGGFFFEAVLFALFGEDMPPERKGQIRMGENFVFQFIRDNNNNIGIHIFYRGEERFIDQQEIQASIQKNRVFTPSHS